MKNFNLNKIQKIFFSGIGGIGISALAKWMVHLNKTVIGSDINQSEITDTLQKKGIKIYFQQKPENITKDIDLFIYSPAVPPNHPERQKAKEYKIPQLSYPEFLGILSKNYYTIAISGTHGKSTVTALTGWILEKAQLDPTVVVGSKMKFWEDNLRLGKSKYLVAEACEWKAHMLQIQPKIIILNNLELDHPDYYKNVSQEIQTFQKFANKLKTQDLLILNGDDKNLAKIKPKSRILTFGIKNKRTDLIAKNIRVNSKKHLQTFEIYYQKKSLGQFEIKLPGIINVYNCLGPILVALNLNIDVKTIKLALKSFPGLWRRLEKICYYKKALIFADYGHHPTAVRQTLKAIKDFYPKNRIVLIFQPHEHTRTKVLFSDYTKSFDQADVLILNEIYTVPGRENQKQINSVSSKDLAQAIQRRNKKIKIIYTQNLDQTKQALDSLIKPKDIVIIMGAGDIYKIIAKLK